MSKKLPQGWKEYKLGEIATYVNGKAFKPSEWSERGTPIVRIQNLTDESKPYNYYTKDDIPGKYVINSGDILISWSASLGIFEWNKGYAFLNQHIFKVVFDKIEINKKYFIYVVRDKLLEMERHTHGSTMKHITKGNFDKMLIVLPTLEEQERIVSILERAESAIKKRKECNRLLDELVKSRFIEMFGDPVLNHKGWDTKNLGTLGYFKNGMNYKQSDSGFNIKFLGVGEFKYGNIINNSNMLSTLELQEKPNDEYLLKDGDIVFVRSNGSKELVGRSVLIRQLGEDTTYSGFCIRYRNQSNEITPEFLISLFSDAGFKSYFKKDSRGANINNLNQQMLSSLNIILPPIELQNEFVEFVYQVDKLKFEMENSLEELENNFNSLMQRAFNGEL